MHDNDMLVVLNMARQYLNSHRRTPYLPHQEEAMRNTYNRVARAFLEATKPEPE